MAIKKAPVEKANQVAIEITIRPDGTIESKMLGIDGPACSIESKFLDALGKVVKDSPTEDFFKEPDHDEKAKLVARR